MAYCMSNVYDHVHARTYTYIYICTYFTFAVEQKFWHCINIRDDSNKIINVDGGYFVQAEYVEWIQNCIQQQLQWKRKKKNHNK